MKFFIRNAKLIVIVLVIALVLSPLPPADVYAQQPSEDDANAKVYLPLINRGGEKIWCNDKGRTYRKAV